MCATGTFALDQSKTFFDRRKTPADRNLQTLGNEQTDSCGDQINSCSVNDLPLKEWGSMLKAMKPEPDSIFSNLIVLLESLENVDMTKVSTISEKAALELTTKSIQDIQEAVDSMEVAAVEEEDSQVSENQFYSVLKTISSILGGFLMGFGFNPRWLTIIGETADRIIASGSVDALSSLMIVAQALITYGLPLLIDVLQSLVAPASTARSASLCSEAMNCRFNQMVSEVIPALVSAAFAVTANTP